MAEQKTQPNEPLLSPLMRWFLLAMILANIAGTMSRLLMPIYLTELGASVGQVGLVFTLTSVVILALQVLGGWISDNIGRLRAIAIGSVGGVHWLHPHAAGAHLAVDAGGADGQPGTLRPGGSKLWRLHRRELERSQPRQGVRPYRYDLPGDGHHRPAAGRLAGGAATASSPCCWSRPYSIQLRCRAAHLDGAHHALGRREASHERFRWPLSRAACSWCGRC